jgi:hypothetical protein
LTFSSFATGLTMIGPMAVDIVLGLAAAFIVTNGAAAVTNGAAAVANGAAVPAPERAFSVAPGVGATPFTSASWPRGGAPRLVWTGFQVTDAGSRVFVQVTRDVELDVQTVKGGLAVMLRKCRIHMRNNSRTLDTRFFETPVKEISVHQRRNGVQLDIALKEPASATPHKQPGPAGTQFWVLEFAPTAASKASPRERKDRKELKKPETASAEQRGRFLK